MLSEPVEKMASPVTTPEAGPPQDIPIHDTRPQRTMRVKRRNSSTKPVDVPMIGRAVDRCCTGLSDIHPFRIATKTINGPYDGATTRKPRMIRDGFRLHHREERGGVLRWVISKLSGTHERPLVVRPRGLH